MAFDAHKNFAYSQVNVAPSPASSGTSLTVYAGDGTKFPAVSFNATVWPQNQQPSPANAEIVRVTAISTDTFTITRTQESTNARSIVVGDQIAATVTAKTITDIESAAPNGAWTNYSGTIAYTSTGGTPTTVTTVAAKYIQSGKTVYFRFDFQIINKGTATGNLIFTLPVTALDTGAGGGASEYQTTGAPFAMGLLDTTHAYISNFAASFVTWTNSYYYRGTLVYEAA